MAVQDHVALSLADPVLDAFRAEVRAWLHKMVPVAWLAQRDQLAADEIILIRRGWDRITYSGGFAGVAWPREFGGRGLGVLEELVYYEECALAGAPDGLSRIGRLLVGPTLIAHGTPSQRARYLPQILSGEEIWCQGFSEPNAGSDLAAVETSAVRQGDHYVVSGTKIWTSFAQHANRCLLLAKTSHSRSRHHNLSLLIVDMRQPGVSVSPIRQITGVQEFNEVCFDEVLATVADRIGEEHEGWRVAMTTLAAERGALEAMTKYMEMRDQLVQFEECLEHTSRDTKRLKEMRTRLELIRHHARRVGELQARGSHGRRPPRS